MTNENDDTINTIVVYQIGDIKLVHMGAFARFMDENVDEVIEAISDADVVMIPVGANNYSIALDEIMSLMDTINTRTIIPCHYNTNPDRRYYGLATLDKFLAFVSDDVPVVEFDELTVESEMPFQITLLEQWTFTN